MPTKNYIQVMETRLVYPKTIHEIYIPMYTHPHMCTCTCVVPYIHTCTHREKVLYERVDRACLQIDYFMGLFFPVVYI